MNIEQITFNTKKLFVIFFDALILLFCFIAVSYFFYSSLGFKDILLATLFSLSNIIFLSYKGSYKVVWNLIGFSDVLRIGLSIIITSLFFLMIIGFKTGLSFISFLIFLSFNLIILSRLIYGNWRKIFRQSFLGSEKILIIGAGEAGSQLFKSLQNNPQLDLNPIGFIDDHPVKHDFKIHNAPVFGNIDDLAKITTNLSIKKVIVAIPSATNREMQRILDIANSSGLEIRTIPSLKNILDDRVNPHHIKELEPEDLLGRDSISLDQSSLSEMLSQKCILVTGAGGSIGGELCDQICKFMPMTIILFEQSEYSLYELDMSLSKTYPNINIIPVVGDVRNYSNIEIAIANHNPDILFHAAAYKHVPLMELNPLQSISTNISGTYNVARAAGEHKVPRFVLISTDKAVNPTNIMGATKRAAEIVCQTQSYLFSKTKYMVVRFGNVLGSSGSVIPLFKKQISEGGPITVTHKDIVRYFMSIPEACQLVMQASALGKGGEIFVLDMGEPVKIIDLAKKMIQLSGLKLDIDISIKITGLRPGEKLYEECLADGEITDPTLHSKILIAKNRTFGQQTNEKLNQLLDIPTNTDKDRILDMLKALVPEFSHNNNTANK